MMSHNKLYQFTLNAGLFLIYSLMLITVYRYCFTAGPDYYAHMTFVQDRSIKEIMRLGLPHLFVHYCLNELAQVLGKSINSLFFGYTSLSILAVLALKNIFLKLIFPGLYSVERKLILLISGAAGAIFMPILIKTSYLGIWSPLALHNPTIQWVKPFALSSLILFYYWLERQKAIFLITCSLLVALSSFVKPNFTIAALPAFLLLRLFIKIKAGDILLFILPGAVVLLFQFIVTYYAPESQQQSGVILTLAGPWRVYTPHVVFALLQNLAGLLVIVVAKFKDLFKDSFYNYLFLTFLIALLQALFLAESGPRYEGMNFVWGYVLAVEFIYLYLVGFVFYNVPASNIKAVILFVIALHVLSGAYFLLRVAYTIAPFAY